MKSVGTSNFKRDVIFGTYERRIYQGWEKNTNSKGKYIIYKATKRSAFVKSGSDEPLGADSLYVLCVMCYVLYLYLRAASKA